MIVVYTALFLIHSKANITKCSFLSNTGTYQFPLDNVFLQGDEYKLVGGAIAAYQSELWITVCEFRGNSAEIGGALFIEETTIMIGYTLFENNFAKAHDNGQSDLDVTRGVISAYWNCYVNINYSTFSNNSGLKRLQGVLFSYKSIIFVHECLFVDSVGNVFDIVRSNLTDWNSIYKNNNNTTGAVLSARWNSNVTHINCQFTSNHAVFKGGVVYADHYCTLVLKFCDVNDNTAIYGGAINVELLRLEVYWLLLLVTLSQTKQFIQ